MKTILEELYNGNLYPNEQIVPKDPEYRSVNKRMSEQLAAWKKKLPEEDYDQLEALLDLRSEIGSMDAAGSFVHGFRLGALVMIEVLAGKEELASGEG